VSQQHLPSCARWSPRPRRPNPPRQRPPHPCPYPPLASPLTPFPLLTLLICTISVPPSLAPPPLPCSCSTSTLPPPLLSLRFLVLTGLRVQPRFTPVRSRPHAGTQTQRPPRPPCHCCRLAPPAPPPGPGGHCAPLADSVLPACTRPCARCRSISDELLCCLEMKIWVGGTRFCRWSSPSPLPAPGYTPCAGPTIKETSPLRGDRCSLPEPAWPGCVRLCASPVALGLRTTVALSVAEAAAADADAIAERALRLWRRWRAPLGPPGCAAPSALPPSAGPAGPPRRGI